MSVSLAQKRDIFIKYLYGLQITSSQVSESRRTLALLRRSFSGPRQQYEAYGVIFPKDPPESEQDVWLLIAGLFALHPQTHGAGNRSLGSSMRELEQKRGNSVSKRFEQLLGREKATLPYHLRQGIRLLATNDIPVNYGKLLDDLVVLMGDGYRGEAAHRIRLGWARDFHRAPDTSRSDGKGKSTKER